MREHGHSSVFADYFSHPSVLGHQPVAEEIFGTLLEMSIVAR
jgi:hypothetical protein